MSDTAAVVVVGGGVIGASIACALAARGVRDVILLEQGALAGGASGRSSALVRMHHASEVSARLALASLPVFVHWADRFEAPPVFTRTGFVAAVGRADAEALHRNVAMLRRIGVDTRTITPDDLKALQPFLAVDDLGAAAYEPGGGYVSPADVVAGFARRARRLGARIVEGRPVTGLVARRGRVAGVETTRGRIEAGRVIVAAGAWSARLCRSAGVDLPVRPKAIDTVLVERPPTLAAPHMTVVDHGQGGAYFRPESRALTLVGLPSWDWDIDPDAPSTRLPADAPLEAARVLTYRIPDMAGASLVRGYRAFDGYSPDRHPLLGAVDGVEGLYVAAGFSGSGFKLAPSVGTCMAEVLTEGAARTVDIGPLRPGRFADGRPIEPAHPYAGPAPRAAARS